MGSVSIDDREKYPDGMATSILWFCLKGSMMPEDFQFPCGEFPLLFGDLEDPLYISCFIKFLQSYYIENKTVPLQSS